MGERSENVIPVPMHTYSTGGASAARIVVILGLLWLSFGPTAQAADVSGARDPLNLVRVPDSWIVGYERDETLKRREYALGRVDRTRREVRVEHEVRASASREWATYEMPAGTPPEEVIRHYLGVLDIEPLFTCRGRDCGRSNLWANQIFKQAILYGPDANQFYFAGELQDALIALYVIERGNKRVYAHLEVLRPDRDVALSRNAEALDNLAGEGMALLEGITPGRMGALDDEATARLAELASGMAVFRGQTVYVVCHLYGPDSAAVLIQRSTACAEQAVQALDTEDGPELVPFGAGPLLPRVGTASRIELVLPHRLSHGS
jgi:hypothetical protein